MTFARNHTYALTPQPPRRESRPNTPEEIAAIEQFVRENGVKRCPTAIIAPTTASLPAETCAEHQARGPLPSLGPGYAGRGRKPSSVTLLRRLVSSAATVAARQSA